MIWLGLGLGLGLGLTLTLTLTLTDTGLFRAARKDNLVGTLLFSFVATNLAGFSVPVEVAGLTPGLNQALILILNPNP